jgi:serine/threonine-protein kinase
MSDEELIDGIYQFVMSIASGSSSQVWEVVEKASGRHLAMKVLKKDVPEFKQNKVQLRRESEILKALDHPQIVKFERYSSNRDYTYILMEHFRASNLKLQLKSDMNKVHLRIRPLFEGICSALSHVHQKGFVHRDIKPDNILINRAGEVRLCDFSLSSKQVKGIGKMLAGKLKAIQGTRTYIAPETIRRQQPTIQTDLYSLGVLFYEVLTGRTPFQAPTPEELLQKHLKAEPNNPSEHNPNVSPEMDRLISKLLKKKPADRPATVDEVLAELKRIRIFKEDVIDEEATRKANEDAEFMSMVAESRLDSRADAKLKEMMEKDAEFAKRFVAEKAEKDRKKSAESEKHRERVKAAEAAQAKRAGSSPTSKKPAASPAPQPVVQTVIQQVHVPMPMPMAMPGYQQPGFPGYPQGYAPYPQGQVPMMPMQPGAIPPAQPPVVNSAPPASPVAPHKPAAASRPAQPTAAQAAPAKPARQPAPAPQPSAPPAARPANQPAATAKKAPPAAPAKPNTSPIARPVARATPATPENEDLEYMTELPDVM